MGHRTKRRKLQLYTETAEEKEVRLTANCERVYRRRMNKENRRLEALLNGEIYFAEKLSKYSSILPFYTLAQYKGFHTL